MRPIRRALLTEATPRGARLDCGGGLSCRISFLLPDLVRVIYLKNERPVAPRTWMVPAYGDADVPLEGLERRVQQLGASDSVLFLARLPRRRRNFRQVQRDGFDSYSNDVAIRRGETTPVNISLRTQ